MESVQSGEPLSILVIVAHPHDFTHVSGTCGNHIEDGDRVAVVFLTNGGTTHNELLYDEMLKSPDQRDAGIVQKPHADYVAQKESEMRSVCDLFGIRDITVLPNEDNFIKITEKMVEDLATIICDRRPDVVITQRPQHLRQHQVHLPDDHFITAEAAHHGIARAMQVKAGTDRRPHNVTQIFYIGVDTGPNEIDLFVDITDQVEKRIQAEAMFASQGHTPEKSRRRVELCAGFYGWYGRVAYAEPFIRANPELMTRLPLSKVQRAISLEMHGQREKRLGRQG